MGKLIKAKISALSKEKYDKLISLGGLVKGEYIIIDSDKITHNNMCKKPTTEFTHNIICKSMNNTQNLHTNICVKNESKDFIWEEYPFTDNIDALRRIKEYGLPEKSEDRIKLLECLSNKQGESYPLTYEYICKYYPKFSDVYSNKHVMDLIQKVNTETNENLLKNLEDAKITKEEKALLGLVISINMDEKAYEVEIDE